MQVWGPALLTGHLTLVLPSSCTTTNCPTLSLTNGSSSWATMTCIPTNRQDIVHHPCCPATSCCTGVLYYVVYNSLCFSGFNMCIFSACNHDISFLVLNGRTMHGLLCIQSSYVHGQLYSIGPGKLLSNSSTLLGTGWRHQVWVSRWINTTKTAMFKFMMRWPCRLYGRSTQDFGHSKSCITKTTIQEIVPC